jgi:hypothetical protein
MLDFKFYLAERLRFAFGFCESSFWDCNPSHTFNSRINHKPKWIEHVTLTGVLRKMNIVKEKSSFEASSQLAHTPWNYSEYLKVCV